MKSVRVYPYRWAVLLALMLVMLASEMQWLVLAPVSRAAAVFYAGQISSSDSLVGPDLLTLIHLVLFVFLSIPASYAIDRLGLKRTLRISAFLVAVFSLLKGFGADRFWVVAAAQAGLSIANVLVLNSVTAVTARWFPLRERGFAAGLVSLAQYLGLLLVMIISPQVVGTNPHLAGYGEGVSTLLFRLGIATSAAAVTAIFLFREKPPTPASLEPFEREDFINSFKLLFHKKSMAGFIMIFGLLWGLFNVFIAKIDSIAAFIGVENSNGVMGVILLGGGMVGSVVVPALSDYLRKRKSLFLICTLGVFLGFLVFTFMPVFDRLPGVNTPVIGFIAAGLLGFFFQSVIPLGFQYGAELSYPVQEASSQGVLLQNGHLVGVVILLFMNLNGGRYLEHVLIASVVLLFAALLGLLFIRESPVIVTEDERLKKAAEKESVRQS